MKTAVRSALLLLLASPALADVTIQPGDVHSFAQADGCSTALVIPNAVEDLARAHVECDAAGRRVRAEVRPIVGAGWIGFQTVKARSSILNDFEVGATAETAGNTVGAWVTYDVQFKGFMAFIGFLSNPTVELVMTLTDLTENKQIKGESVWSRDGEGFGVSIPNVPIDMNFGGGVNDHAVTNTFATVLRRGHTYRLRLDLICSVFSDGSLDIGSECDYMGGYLGGGEGAGAGWTRLEVKAGIDETEILSKLEELTNHTHTYLTGHGVGHNNTAAETGPPVEGDGTTVPQPEPERRGRRKGPQP